MEDRDARGIAETLGLTTIGALGLLLEGHRQAVLATDELVDAMRAMRRAGRISQVLLERVIKERIGH